MAILGDLWVKLGLKKQGFDSGMKDAEKRTSTLGEKVKGMGATMKTVWTAIGAIVAGKAASMVVDMAKLAAQAEGIKTAFGKIADKNILDGLRQATRGTVDDVTLMQKTIQAANFGIPIEQLATYFKFATERAIQTGESVDYLVDSIVTGLGRKSVMILDNLGISAADIREQMGKTGDMASAVGAIIQREMEKAGKVQSTTAVTIQQTRAAWENLKVSIGNSNVIQKVLSGLAKAATELVNSFDKIAKAGGVGAYNLQQSIAEEVEYLKASGWSTKQIRTAMVKKSSDYFETGNAYPLTKQTDLMNIWGTISKKSATEYFNALSKAAKELADAEDDVAASTQTVTKAEETQTEMVKGAIPLLEEQIKKLNEKKDSLTDINDIASTNSQIKALEDELDNLKQITDEYLKQREILSTMPKLQSAASSQSLGGRAAYDELPKARKKYFDEQIEEGKKASEAFYAQMEKIEQAGELLSSALEQGLSSSLDYLSDCIGGVEDFDGGKMLQTLLGPLADAAIKAGIVISGVGDALIGLQESLMTMNPAAAIAAGAALIAIGVAAKAGLAAIAKGSSKSNVYSNDFKYTGGYTTNSLSAASSVASIDVNVTGKISGQDIVLASEKYNNNKRR